MLAYLWTIHRSPGNAQVRLQQQAKPTFNPSGKIKEWAKCPLSLSLSGCEEENGKRLYYSLNLSVSGTGSNTQKAAQIRGSEGISEWKIGMGAPKSEIPSGSEAGNSCRLPAFGICCDILRGLAKKLHLASPAS